MAIASVICALDPRTGTVIGIVTGIWISFTVIGDGHYRAACHTRRGERDLYGAAVTANAIVRMTGPGIMLKPW